MASLVPRNFSEFRAAEKNIDENSRPDSPTVMITKSKPRGQLLSDSTIYLIQTYESCSPEFRYDQSCPARCLTKPSEAVHNENYDNEDYNYILYVNDKLQSPEGQVYIIIDSLGEGTFGQVVKCRDSQGLLCAAKVIKNKPAYYIQGLIEVKILSKLNNELDSNDSSHIVRMKDFFVFRNHLVIIFELLSLNLYEILRKNLLRGVSLSLIRKFTKQMLEALCVLEKGNIIHCDMKPENVLLADDKANIKVIDFGSACFENATIYTYIQSRYYRSPEVLLGCPYGSEIDSWSLGCICAELFIGIPLFPGANDYDQIYRITQILGTPPESMLREGRFHEKYFTKDSSGYRLKSREEFMQVICI
jgi:dual specificity protein kinase YAK1